ncbi:MAG: DNA repair protein RadC [Planctomycetes bacterium]|nr:DNA repair protein RadC [Planctomycetota bacterium]
MAGPTAATAGALRIRDLPATERPRERLLAEGPQGLSDGELVAILLGHGCPGTSALDLGRRLLGRYGSLRALARAGAQDLAACEGMGEARAARLAAAAELGRRAAALPARRGEAVAGPEEVFRLLAPRLRDARQERFLALHLDTRHRLERVVEVSVGSLDNTPVHPREAFAAAVRESAAAVIFAHNHPSGDPTPSPEDLALTERLRAVGELLGIPVLDHVVVADGGWTSASR